VRHGRGLFAIALLLGVSACGDSGTPDVRHVDAVSASTENRMVATSVGAAVDGDEDEDAPGTTTTLPYSTAESRAVSASADTVEAFFDAIRANDFERALQFSTGNALVLVTELRSNARCDVRLDAVESTRPAVAKSAGPGRFETDATAELMFNTGLARSVTSVFVGEVKNGGFRVDDLEVDGRPLEEYVDVGRGSNRASHEVRVQVVDLCVGPGGARGVFRATNESDAEIRPVDAFFRRPDGSRLEFTAGHDSIMAIIPPGGTVEWTFEVHGDDLWNGFVVFSAPDLEGILNDEVVERAFPLIVGSLFSGR
jgi:hypothetical protein